MLAQELPSDRRIVGIDLADGMVDLASQRLSESGLWCDSFAVMRIGKQYIHRCMTLIVVCAVQE